MKIIVTTSNNYLHLLKIFIYLFNKYWDKNVNVEIVGYNKPDFELPKNFNFVSLGIQDNDKKSFTRDLRKYFANQDKWFIWLMEDTFIKEVNLNFLDTLKVLTTLYGSKEVGRINLTNECIKQEHENWGLIHSGYNNIKVYTNTQTSKYRLSTQPSIWNRDFLLKYMENDLDPWEFETQYSNNDGYKILGFDSDFAPLKHNEGVRRFDLYKYNFEGIEEKTINEMLDLRII